MEARAIPSLPDTLRATPALALIAISLAVVLAIDLFVPRSVPAALVGVAGWAALSLILAALVAADSAFLLRAGLTGRLALTLLTLALVIGVLLWPIGDPRAVSQEAGVELRCMHWLLENDPKIGFWGTCLFGYPARQTYLHYLPTWLAGPSLVAMNVGGLLYVLAGLPVFASELARLAPQDRRTDALLALTLAGLLHFFFVHETTLRPNMASFPLGISLLAVGTFWRYRRTPSLVNGGLIVAVLLLAIHSYTPDLALVGGGIAAILLYAIQRDTPRVTRGLAVAAAGMLALALWRTFEYRYDVRLVPDRIAPGGAGSFEALRDAAAYIAFSQGFVTNGLKAVAVAVLTYLAVFMRRIDIALLLALIAGCLIAAGVTQGYFFGSAWDRLHRASVAIPFALLVFYLAGQDALERFGRMRGGIAVPLALAALAAITAWTGIEYRQSYLASKSRHPHELLLERLADVRPTLATDARFTVVVGPEVHVEFASLNDLLLYRYPNAITQVLSSACSLERPLGDGMRIAAFRADSPCASGPPLQPICAAAFWRGMVQVDSARVELCAAR